MLLTAPRDGTGRSAVVEQGGRISIFVHNPGITQVETFLDISGRVSRGGNEEGLLGLAFDPGYAETGVFYLYYSASGPRRSVLSRFTVSDDPNRADASSEEVLLEVAQPFSNHNGGMIAFGPDGFLYVGLGDGGAGGDPRGNGQNAATLLASILRIEVEPGLPGYRVPEGNPSLGPGARPEIWAYGLRNPWRFSFDRDTGDLWVGDVGQSAREEIDLVVRGGNYGWNVTEGTRCFQPSSGCDTSGLQAPVIDYGHNQGCSVTGGYVYRGQEQPSLRGVYLYADFCSGIVWGLRHDGQELVDARIVAEPDVNVSSFGEDAAGELYVTGFDGVVCRVVAK